MKQKKQGSHITAFYVETLMLIGVFIVIILVLTETFALGRQESARAQALNDAVCISRNTAEAAASSDSKEAMQTLLDAAGEASSVSGDTVTVHYNTHLEPDPDGRYTVTATWEPRAAKGGSMVRTVINVEWSGLNIYTLKTQNFRQEAGR